MEDAAASAGWFGRVDARIKVISLVLLLACISLLRQRVAVLVLLLIVAAIAVGASAGVSVLAVVRRSLLVLPFCIVFAMATWIGGDHSRASNLVFRTYGSAVITLIFVAATPISRFLEALQRLRVPVYFVAVVWLIYRYLFLLKEESIRIRQAALARGGFSGAAGFRAAGGAVGVLFARSYDRGERIQHAMLARGYAGRFPIARDTRPDATGYLFLSCACLIGLACIAASRL